MYHKPLAYGIRAPQLRKIAESHESLTITQIEAIFWDILHETHKAVSNDIVKWIVRFVPKMTGRLRRDLLRHLRTSYVKNSVLRIYIQTSIDYAEKVNKYTTSQVRHKGKKIKYRGKTIILWDPQAIGKFFDKMIIFAIKSILVNLVKIKRKYASKTKLKFKDMRIIKLW